MKRIIFGLFLLPLLGMGFTSCNDDDDNQDAPALNNRVFDELAYIQNALVKVDAQGNFKSRVYGVALDPADTTEVSIGVENAKEAKDIFMRFFPDTTLISDNGTMATLTTRKGTAKLSTEMEDDGTVAVARFDIPGLKYISTMNFILNSAWPENSPAPSECEVGKWYPCDYKTYNGTAKEEDFLCIRPAAYGKPALLICPAKKMSISPLLELTISNQYPCLDNFPSNNKMEEICLLIGGEHWSEFQQYANGNLLPGEYWTCDSEGYGTIFNFQYTVSLPDGASQYYNCFDEPVAHEIYFLELY